MALDKELSLIKHSQGFGADPVSNSIQHVAKPRSHRAAVKPFLECSGEMQLTLCPTLATYSSFKIAPLYLSGTNVLHV